MQKSDGAREQIEAYLKAVEAAMGGRPEGVKREILEELRGQIEAAAELTDGSGEAVGRILAEMDAPESFREEGAEAEGNAPAGGAGGAEGKAERRGGAGRLWMTALLMVLSLGLGYWWGASRTDAGKPKRNGTGGEHRSVLTVRKVEATGMTEDLEANLLFKFSADPDIESLKQKLTLSDADGEEIPWRIAGRMGNGLLALTSGPLSRQELRVQLEGGLKAASAAIGENADGGEWSFKVDGFLELTELKCEAEPFHPTMRIEARFNRRLAGRDILDHVTVEPEAKWSGAVAGNRVELYGEFEPGETYTVKVGGGVWGADGSRLAKTVARKIRMAKPEKALRLAKDARTYYFTPGESGILRVETCGLGKEGVEVRLCRMHTNNAARFAAEQWWQDPELYGKETKHKYDVVTDDERTGTGHADVDLGALASKRGVYAFEIWSTGSPSRCGPVGAVVVSDLGVTLQRWRDERKAVVWVNRLGTGEAVEGACAELWSQKGQKLAEGRTGADGSLLLDWSGADLEDLGSDRLVSVWSGDDWTCVDSRMKSPAPAGAKEGRAWLEAGRYEALVWGDRELYRPGERALVQALVRDGEQRGPGKAFPAVLRLMRDGQEVLRVPVEVQADGGVTAELELNRELATGEYAVTLRMPGREGYELGKAALHVEEFVPPQIRVAVWGEGAGRRGGERAKIHVRAENLFGGGAAGLKVDLTARVLRRAFCPAGWEGWTFGTSGKADAYEYDTWDLTLDGEGRAEQEFALPRKLPKELAGGAVQLEAEATVHEAGGRTVTRPHRIPYDLHPRYIGLRPCWEGTAEAKEPQRVELALAEADGKASAEDRAVELILKKVEWHNAQRSDGWTSERQEIEIKRVALVAGGTARSWEFTLAGGGEYVLQARDPEGGAETRLAFQAGDTWWWAEKSMERPEAVDVKWNPARAHPGDRVKLELASPFAGEALITLSGKGPLERRRVTMEGDHAEVELTVGEDWPETVYATVNVIRGATPETGPRGSRALGNGRLRVEHAERKLKVSVGTPERIRPQETLRVEVKAETSDGSAAGGRVTVTATDVALLELTDTEAPRVADAFTDPRRWMGDQRDPYGRLLPVLAGRSAAGGDEARKLRKRLNPVESRRFRPLSLWECDAELDAEGRARVEIPVPEFTGELRVTAVAHNREAAGVTTSAVKVARSVAVEPALPRFAAPGDRFEAGLPIWNRTETAVELEAEYAAAGPLQTAKARETIEVAGGGRAQGSVELTAGPRAGAAEFRVRVKGGGETYEETLELPVRPASGLEGEERFVKLAPGEEIELDAPEGWLEGSVTAEADLSPSASVQMGGALEALQRYPYGCLEQTVSKAYPLVGSEGWTGRLAPSAWAAGDPRSAVEAAIRRVLRMADPAEGFRMWPESGWHDENAGLYALEFLVEAKAAGYAVPEGLLELELDWAMEKSSTPEWDAWAVDVLGQAGRKGWEGRMSRLCEKAGKAGDEAKIHLARAQQRAGHPREALKLLESVPVPRERRAGRGEGWVESPVRRASLLLRAWLEVDAESPVIDELVQVLRSWQENGSWGEWATQDNAMGLAAFGKIAQRLPERESPVRATAEFVFGDRTETSEIGPTNRWRRAADGVRRVRLANRGEGPLCARVHWSGVPETPPPAVDRGVEIRRQIFAYDGTPLNGRDLKRGELAVVKLTVDTLGETRDSLVVEDLLPAGWEIENGALSQAATLPWVEKKKAEESCKHSEARDDRMLYFPHQLKGRAEFHYTVRAVTAGDFLHPGASVSEMYDPSVRSVGESTRVTVRP